MAKVYILPELIRQIQKLFKGNSDEIFDLMEELENNPHKGKTIGNIGRIVIKELKYRNFRFYFIVEGHKLKCVNAEELKELLIKFVRMSDKNLQQGTINEIKHILKLVGFEEFS